MQTEGTAEPLPKSKRTFFNAPTVHSPSPPCPTSPGREEGREGEAGSPTTGRRLSELRRPLGSRPMRRDARGRAPTVKISHKDGK